MWWLLVGVCVGFCVGFFLAALLTMASREDAWHDGYAAARLERRSD
jgi:hypothetical protein